jgi:hypothetical protein
LALPPALGDSEAESAAEALSPSPVPFFLSAPPAPAASAPQESAGAVAWFPSQLAASAALRARSLFGFSQAASALLASAGTQPPPTQPPPPPTQPPPLTQQPPPMQLQPPPPPLPPLPSAPLPPLCIERMAIREPYHEARRRVADLVQRGLVVA